MFAMLDFFIAPLVAIRKANEFENVDFMKNCENVTAFFLTSAKYRGTI